MRLILVIMLILSSFIAVFIIGIIVSQHDRHDCIDCFWNLYDGLAAKGKVEINEGGAWSVRHNSDSTFTISGFSRVYHLGTLAPGESKVVSFGWKDLSTRGRTCKPFP